MKYRPPLVGEQKHRPPLAAVTATLAVVRRLLERDGERRAWFLRGADRSCGLRAWNSYLPGCLGGGGAAPSHGRRPAVPRAHRPAPRRRHMLRKLRPWRVKLTRALTD